MLSLTFIALSLAGLAVAKPTQRAAGGLSISLSSPATSIDSVGELKLIATVKNVGDESLKVLKHGTILDNVLPTRSFSVSKDGVSTAFTGIKLQVSIPDLEESAWVVIPAGESVTAEHDISALYDFSSAGPGTFSFEPVTHFQIAEAEEKVDSISDTTRVNVESTGVKVEITKDVAKRELEVLDKRATVSCTSSSTYRSFITSSQTEGKSLASLAASYISTYGASDSLYRAYWGSASTSTVRGVFTAVANENSASRTLSCTDPYGACGNGVIAYTLIATTNIYFCSIFYNEVATTNLCGGTSVASRNIRGGTTLHELTHATSGTDDVTYGCSADQALSDSQAVINADNYNCFATQVYYNTQC